MPVQRCQVLGLDARLSGLMREDQWLSVVSLWRHIPYADSCVTRTAAAGCVSDVCEHPGGEGRGQEDALTSVATARHGHCECVVVYMYVLLRRYVTPHPEASSGAVGHHAARKTSAVWPLSVRERATVTDGALAAPPLAGGTVPVVSPPVAAGMSSSIGAAPPLVVAAAAAAAAVNAAVTAASSFTVRLAAAAACCCCCWPAAAGARPRLRCAALSALPSARAAPPPPPARSSWGEHI